MNQEDKVFKTIEARTNFLCSFDLKLKEELRRKEVNMSSFLFLKRKMDNFNVHKLKDESEISKLKDAKDPLLYSEKPEEKKIGQEIANALRKLNSSSQDVAKQSKLFSATVNSKLKFFQSFLPGRKEFEARREFGRALSQAEQDLKEVLQIEKKMKKS